MKMKTLFSTQDMPLFKDYPLLVQHQDLDMECFSCFNKKIMLIGIEGEYSHMLCTNCWCHQGVFYKERNPVKNDGDANEVD